MQGIMINYNIGFEALHGDEQFAVTACVYPCQVEFGLEIWLSLYSYCGDIHVDCSGVLVDLKALDTIGNCLAFTVGVFHHKTHKITNL